MGVTTPLALWRGVGGEASIQRQYHLTVAARLKLILSGIATTNLLMVVYLTVHRQHLFPVGREQRLSPTLWVHNAQSLVSQNGAAATVYSTPVRSAVADFLTHLQCFFTQLMRLLLNV